MDISELGAQFREATTNGDFPVLDPFGNKTDFIVAIAGPYSYARREARYKYQDAVSAATGRGKKPLEAKEAEKIEDEYLAAHIVGWHGLTRKGEPVIRTDHEALHLIRTAPWIRAQVQKIVSDEKAFMKHIMKKTPMDDDGVRALGVPVDASE